MAVAIKRVIQFSYAKMNSVQSEQTRIRAKNKYKNDHISEEFKKFNLIIPGLFGPPVRTLRATIPENESHIFR